MGREKISDLARCSSRFAEKTAHFFGEFPIAVVGRLVAVLKKLELVRQDINHLRFGVSQGKVSTSRLPQDGKLMEVICL